MTDKTKEALVHYEAALKEAFPSGATGDVFYHWNEARKALVEESSGTEQPAQPQQEPVAWMFQHEETGRTMCVDAQQVEWGFEKGNPRLKKIAPLYTSSPAQRKPWVGLTDFIKHEVENAYDWSEWVCPDPESYLMKCCDCGLVHEAQFRVAKYKPAPSDKCEVVSDPDLQAQFRMRRSEQWSPADTAHRSGGLPMAEQPAPKWQGVRFDSALHDQPAQRTWVALTNDERVEVLFQNPHLTVGGLMAVEAKLREKNA